MRQAFSTKISLFVNQACHGEIFATAKRLGGVA
jgi:hypothetical protein